MTLDATVWRGVQSFLDNYLEIQSCDDVVIAYTPDSREPAAWVYLALEDRGLSPTLIGMAPLRDPGLQERLSAVIPDRRSRPGRLVCLIFELHTASHNATFKAAFSKYHPDQYDVVRAINSGRDLFTTGLALHPRELSALNAAILERCRSSERLRIETPSGSQLQVAIDNERFQWLSSRGVRQPGKFRVIPPGEVATFPAEINGTLIADFAINVNTYFDGDARLDRRPVTATVANGQLASFTCADPGITRFLQGCFDRPHAIRVGELGIGTNLAVRTAVPENSHLNERVPGVHLGFGAHNQTAEATGYSCDVHVDLCAKGGLIWFDDSPEPLDLDKVLPSHNPHPTLMRSEDVVSDDAEDDCCGILT